MSGNVFIIKGTDVKKSISGTYCVCGARFNAVICPEKPSFFVKKRIKRGLKRFEGGYIYDEGAEGIYNGNGFYRTDGSLAMIENIEPLCRKICKNMNIQMPPVIGVYDAEFTAAGADITERLGRICSEIHLFTKSRSAQSYVEYMAEEYGCVLSVRNRTDKTDIIISAERLEKPCGAAVLIDLFGLNAHIEEKRVSELYFSADGFSKEDASVLGNMINGRFYDFLRICGMKNGKNVNFIGYG